MEIENIREYILETLQGQLVTAELDPGTLQGDFDLMNSGLIDSMAFLHLVTGIEDWLGIELDFEDLDPAELTKMGTLCEFIQQQVVQT